jgi:hypothetical protein
MSQSWANPKDLDELQIKLAQSIISMADRVRISTSPSREEIRRITSFYDWDSVFQRIFSAYEKAIEERAG